MSDMLVKLYDLPAVPMLAPGAADKGVADLIAATDDGIYITGNGSWSIDHQRYNFQFTGQRFHRIDGQSDSGSGLGVSIVQRIAELHGQRLHYRAGADGQGVVAEPGPV